MSHDWTDQKQFTLDASDLASFAAVKNLRVLVCGFCKRTLREGDLARWVYVEAASNVFVCQRCDSPDASERFRRRWRDVIHPILERWGDR